MALSSWFVCRSSFISATISPLICFAAMPSIVVSIFASVRSACAPSDLGVDRADAIVGRHQQLVEIADRALDVELLQALDDLRRRVDERGDRRPRARDVDVDRRPVDRQHRIRRRLDVVDLEIVRAGDALRREPHAQGRARPRAPRSSAASGRRRPSGRRAGSAGSPPRPGRSARARRSAGPAGSACT